MFFSIPALYIPETRRYYLTSHSGLWRLCRYSLVPTILANSSAARNFTTLSLTNVTHINALKKTVGVEPFILDIIKDVELPDPITNISNDFRLLLFAHWILDNEKDFQRLKEKYKHLVAITETSSEKSSHNFMMINPTNTSAVREIIGASSLPTVLVNGTLINVIVPQGLKNALFDGWEYQPYVLPLLLQYAKDMDIPISMVNSNGTRYIIQPPPPPKKGKVAHGYMYTKFGWLM